jgi:hypothetical protein
MHETLRFIIERKTGLYTTYIVSFVLFNWKFFYTLFIESSTETTSVLLQALHEFTARFSILGFDWGSLWVVQFIAPAIITWIAITQLPKLNNLAYELQLKYQGERTVMRSKQDKDNAKKIAENKEDEVESLSAIAVATERGAEITGSLPKETVWENEFTESSKFKDVIKQVAYAIYEDNGRIFSGGSRTVSADVLAVADSYNLIEFSDDKASISFTEKGKYMQKLVIRDS